MSDLEKRVERLTDRVEMLEAVNRVLADERKGLRDSLFVAREIKWRQSLVSKPENMEGAALPAVNARPTQTGTPPPAAAPAGSVPSQSLMAVTPAPETKPSQPLAASPAPAVRSSVSSKPAAPRARPSSRRYIRGPRGGCYYINSNGNKTYVDRSMCG